MISLPTCDLDAAAAGNVAALFSAQAARTPERIAVLDDRHAATYTQLDARSGRLACWLRAHGVGPERRVALLLDHSVDMVVASLAVVRTGAAYVPIDAEWPSARIETIVSDCAPGALITSRRSARLASLVQGPTLALQDDAQLPEPSAGVPDPGIQSWPDQLFSVVYTSGTTGTPKGVLVPLRAVVNRLSWMWDTSPYRDGDVALLYRTHAAIGFTWDCFGPLLKGVPVVVAQPAHMRDAAELVDICVRRSITHLMATPSRWSAVLDYLERHAVRWTTLRVARSSGEPLSGALVARWRRVLPDVPLVNTYGATECSTTAAHDASRADGSDRVPVGTALPNVAVHLLDDDGRLVPAGEQGSVCVTGAGLARGYLNKPAVTAERFRPNPHGSRPGERIFCTGDTGTMHRDGTLRIHGRRDRQVKIRGFRVELEEVEAALVRCEGVRSAAVVADARGPNETRLIAFIVLHDGLPWSPKRLRSALLARAPHYLVPANFVRLDEMPLTASGKTDVQRLRARGCPEPVETMSALPCTPAEETLVQIWCSILRRDSVGTDDNFFELGGDSLLAMQMQSHVFDAFGVDVSLSRLFSLPTIRELAADMPLPLESRQPQDRLQPVAGEVS